ncbi:MAG: hypothetical protein ACI4QM_02935 [Alphaproteobacteria bacterium]
MPEHLAEKQEKSKKMSQIKASIWKRIAARRAAYYRARGEELGRLGQDIADGMVSLVMDVEREEKASEKTSETVMTVEENAHDKEHRTTIKTVEKKSAFKIVKKNKEHS